MVRQTAKVLFLEIFGALLLLLLIAAAALVVRLAAGPIDLAIFKDDIERAISRAQGGQPVTIDALQLAWVPEERRISVTGQGILIRDTTGATVARANLADIDLDATSLFLGRVQLNGLELEDGALQVRHLGGDLWSIGGREVTIAIPQGESIDLRSVVNRSNAVAASLFDFIALEEGEVPIGEVRVSDFAIEIYSVRDELIADIPEIDGRFGLDADGQIAFDLTASSPGEGLPETLQLSLEANEARDRLSLSLSVSEWSLEGLMTRLAGRPADNAEVMAGLPLSGSVYLAADREGGVDAFGWQLELREGVFAFAGREYALESADVSGEIDLEAESLALAIRELKSARLSGDFDIRIDQALDTVGAAPMRVELDSPRMTIDARPYAEVVWSATNVEFRGEIDPVSLAVDAERLVLGYGQTEARAQGRFQWLGDAAEGQMPRYVLKASVEADGPLTAEDVFAFWPTTVGSEVRTDVRRRLLGGTITDVTMRFDLYPGRMRDEILDDDAMSISFQGNDVSYQFLNDVPPLEDGVGRGTLKGNSFAIDLVRGRVSEWKAETGRVEIERLKPIGGQLNITGSGSGPIRDALVALQNSELALGREEGFDMTRASGVASAIFSYSRPTGEDVPPELAEYSVEGEYRDAGLTDVTADFDMTESVGTLSVTPERVVMSGFGRMADTDVVYTWTQSLDETVENPSELQARATVTPDVLNRFGLLLRAYLSGEIPVTLTTRGNGADIRSMTAEFELQDARVDVSEIGLRKPLGAPGRAQFEYVAATPARPAFYSGSLVAEGVELDGDIRMTPDNRVDVITLRRAYVASRLDVAGQIARDNLDGLRVTLTGPYLDVSGLFTGMGSFGSEEGLSGNLAMNADVDRLKLDDGLDVRDAFFEAVVKEGRIVALAAEGQTAPGKGFSAVLSEEPDRSRRVKVEADDASFLLLALFDADFVTGGSLTLEGVLAEGDRPTRLDLNLYETRLLRAPLLTQVLSLASLRGLADTLSGDGVLFSRVELPMQIVGKRFVIDGGRASGPALGLTVNGWLELGEDGGINLDGVLVPSFGINSALGGIPIIGDLFVSREGEGVFSLTYSVRGTLARAQVAINPLSAVTPGVLRRIFENPSDTEFARDVEEQSRRTQETENDVPPPPPEDPVDPAPIDPAPG